MYDDTHNFITKDEFNSIKDLCAITNYNGEHYGATKKQIDDSDLYVIDINGIKYLLKHYDGKKIPMVIYIDSNKNVRRKRMEMRGDPIWKINDRLHYDEKAFHNVQDYAVETYVNNNDSINSIKDIAQKIYKEYFE